MSDILDRLKLARTATGCYQSMGCKFEQLIDDAADEIERLRTELSELRAKAEAPAEPTTSYVQEVPDKCDRIVWRNQYYHLPIPMPAQAASVPVAWMVAASGDKWVTLDYAHAKECAEQAEARGFKDALRPLYTAPPEQAARVPDFVKTPLFMYSEYAAEHLHLELVGVIWDVEHGRGFDSVCLQTIKRVSDKLALLAAAPSPTGLDNTGLSK